MKKNLHPAPFISLLNRIVLPLMILCVSCEKEPLIETVSPRSIDGPSATTDPKNGSGSLPSSASMSPHYWVALLVQNIPVANNFYDTRANLLTWSGQNGATTYACSTDCSGLLTGLLKKSYGYSSTFMKNWTGKSDPFASNYYNEVVTQDRFLRITNVNQIMQGDVIALKYPTGSTSTGHIMIADGPAVARTATAPFVNGTFQYEIPVYDCSSSGHGSNDTRYLSSTSWDDGVGRGIFRLYCDAGGALVGYTWSTYSNSVYYNQSQRQLAVGRFIP